METNEIITNARQILKERLDSLQGDVRYCVLLNQGTLNWPAPFPSLLYCFAVIDLLGALYGGDASSPQGISERSRNYIEDVMKYPHTKAILLQQVFRHKLVHLAQPNPKAKYENNNYLWAIHHNNQGLHLLIQPTNLPTELSFWISIWSFVEDICDSVFKPNGYLDRLENELNLQRNFEKAYDEIYK